MSAWGMGLRLRVAACAAVFVLVACPRAHAQSVEPLQPWDLLGSNLGRIYGWPNIMFSAAAVAATPPLVLWADEPVQEFFQDEDPLSNRFGHIALIVGYSTPIVVPLTVYLAGLGGNAELMTAGSAAIQAVVVQATIVSALKWLTDRAGPLDDGDPTMHHWSESGFHYSAEPDHFNFNPLDLTGSLSWPSGHTASNVALVSSLVAFYPDELWLPIVGYPFALAIGVGMIEGDYHWLSDIVAGALIGHVIGWQVGKGFRERFDARRRGEATPSVNVTLGFSTEPLGARVTGEF